MTAAFLVYILCAVDGRCLEARWEAPYRTLAECLAEIPARRAIAQAQAHPGVFVVGAYCEVST